MEKIWIKNYQAGVAAEINVNQYESVNAIFESSFRKFADKPSFSNMGITMNYRELDQLSGQFASFLQHDLKLFPGDRVAIMSPNLLQYPVCLYGILRAGMVVVNVNPLYTTRELEHQLKNSEAKAIIIVENFCHTLEEALKHNTSVRHVITTQLGDLLGFPKALIVNAVVKYAKKMVPRWKIAQSISFMDALKRGASRPFTRMTISHEDIAFLQYTGGTTGISKGAILTHGNIVANMLQAREWISPLIRDGEEVIVTALPLYHIFSLTANCFVFGSIGGHNILITNPRDIPGFVKDLAKYKVTTFTGVNTLFNGLLNNTDFCQLDFSSLRVSLGGAMAVQRVVAEKWKAVTGCPLIEAYGLTESSPAACMNPINLQDYNGSIGLPIPSTNLSIRNDDGKEVPIGESGEIWLQGPQVMRGYWNSKEETDHVLTPDRWLKTGDIGIVDEQGFVKIVDRKKDMILVSGFNVYPNEIEAVIAQHPKVLEVAAIGVPDVKSGEAVKIFVVKRDQSLTEKELRDHCKANLTGYKLPKLVEFRKELPKTNVGKILRRALRT